MLTIRDEQMSALRVRSVRRLSDELFDHLMNRHASTVASMGGEGALRTFIQRHLEQTVRWGIESTAAAAALFELMLQFGPSFERSPLRDASLNILNHPVMTGDLKVDTVWERHDALTQGRPIVQM